MAKGRESGLPGVRFGQAEEQSPTGPTGVTVVVLPPGSAGAVEVRGGAAGTYHLDSLAPTATFGRLDALFFSGGSLYGLDAGRAVREELSRQGRGERFFRRGPRLVSVTGAVLFDLTDPDGRGGDYEELAHRATRVARPVPPAEGSVGAGVGATVGKFAGRGRSCRGGVGYASLRLGTSHHLAALAVVNSLGNVHDAETGRVLAGIRGSPGKFLSPAEGLSRPSERGALPRGTTHGVLLTDLPLDRWSLARLAIGGHDGISLAVRPAHTSTDGDVVYAVSTSAERRGDAWPFRGRAPYPWATIDLLVSEGSRLLSQAIGNAVLRAEPGGRVPTGAEWSVRPGPSGRGAGGAR